MDYYNEIKNKFIDHECYKRIKDYSKNRNELKTYYEVGKLLVEAQGGERRAKYGNGLIKEYSKRLIVEVDKKYSERTLRRIRQFYLLFKYINWSPTATELTWSHYSELLSIKDINKINYYISISIRYRLSKMELREKIKSHEYERLDEETKLKLITKEDITIKDEIKHPIIIRNKYNTSNIFEHVLQKLVLEDIPSFLKELGEGFTFIDNEYKIKTLKVLFIIKQ